MLIVFVGMGGEGVSPFPYPMVPHPDEVLSYPRGGTCPIRVVRFTPSLFFHIFEFGFANNSFNLFHNLTFLIVDKKEV